MGLALFPRITLLLFAATPFGCLIAPHLLVAVPSRPFWHTHPVLAVIA